MNKNKISLILSAAAITLASGCTSIQSTNVAVFGNEYYREKISKSKTHQDLKEYLQQNNMKLGSFVSVSNQPTGGLGNIVIEGKPMGMITAENNKWFRASMTELVQSELSGLLLDVEGYTLTYCGDFSHAIVGENGNFGKMEFTYFLSHMLEGQRQVFLKAPMQSDCAISGFLGDIFYKKKIEINSSPSNAKVSITQTDKSKPITSSDTVSHILKDMASQAMTTMLTDPEMLQALKDYKLTGGKKTTVEQPSKITVPEPTSTPPSSNQSVNLDGFKAQCKGLGFKVGTADFGNCVLQLMK